MERSEIMRRVRSKDTKPELIVRKLTHSLGFRYRLHVKDYPANQTWFFPAKRKSFLFMVVFGTVINVNAAIDCRKIIVIIG